MWTSASFLDNRYIEFRFSPSLPSNAIIYNSMINFEWLRSASWIYGARIKVWDQSTSSWHVHDFTLPTINTDKMEIINVSSYINTVADVNNLKIQFQARDGSCGNGGYTYHDLVELKVDYIVPECYVDKDCDDRNECTVDVCQNYICVHNNKPSSTPCEADGQFCSVDHCDGSGKCVFWKNYDCSDSVGCTVDTCNEQIDQCVHTPDNSLCDDSLYCNGEETCDSTEGCLQGTPVDCSDYNLPGIDTCDNDPDNYHFTWDYAKSFVSMCDEQLDVCTKGSYDFNHTCADNDLQDSVPLGGCDAECDENSDCLCPLDGCIGSDFYDYPVYGDCLSDCTCDVRTDDCHPCHPTIIEDDPRCAYCGDGQIGQGEQCELPNTTNNEYCTQSTSTCDGHRLGTRDALGDCDLVCGCLYDEFSFSCVKGECGAECSCDSDCPQDGWFNTTPWQYVNNDCKRCRTEEYRDYGCSNGCMCDYEVTDRRESCENMNEGMVCDIGNFSCVDNCTKAQEEFTCQSGQCLFNGWINQEQCNPYLCDPDCGNAFCSNKCSMMCGAECESDEDCEGFCEGDMRFFEGECGERCACIYQSQDCSELNGWSNTSDYRWVELDMCNEKEQRKQVYLDYSCQSNDGVECVGEETDERWIDTGGTREKEDLEGPIVTNISVIPNPTSCNLVTTGNASLKDCHKIVEVKYFINQEGSCPGPDTVHPMVPIDGAFDEKEEDAGVELINCLNKPCASGVYNFWVRGKDEFGNWGECTSYTFMIGNVPPTVYNVKVENGKVTATIDASLLLLKVTSAEYFIDTNTPVGGGIMMSAVDGAFDESVEDVEAMIDTSLLESLSEGKHTVYVHGKDNAGNWGNFGTADFFINSPTTTTTIPNGGRGGGGSGSSGGGGGFSETTTTTTPTTTTTMPATGGESTTTTTTTVPPTTTTIPTLPTEMFTGMISAITGDISLLSILLLALMAIISSIVRFRFFK